MEPTIRKNVPTVHEKRKQVMEALGATGSLIDRFERLKEKVLVTRPVLREIMQKKGNRPLYEYAKEYIDVNLNPPIQHRQNELLETFTEEATRMFGPEIATKACDQLTKHYFISTADHMGPICHPFFINANIVTSAPYYKHSDPGLEYVIVFSCSSISFDNSSFPRGLQFHSARNPAYPELQSVGFFGRNVRPNPVFGFRSYTKEDLHRAVKLMKESVRDNGMLQQEMDAVIGLFDEIYSTPEMLECNTYAEQMAKGNLQLWRRYFHHNSEEVPDLLYIEQEPLVAKLLLKYHLDQDTIINHILFDPSYEEHIIAAFEGIDGAFSCEEKWGTYLFWALPKGSKYRLQLWKKGDELVSNDGSYRLKLTPEDVRRALETGEIFTGTLMDFIVLSLYYGLKCIGGFNQVNYLTKMKNAYIKMNVDLGNYRSIEVCARAQTKELCDGLSTAFLGYGENKITLATGMDLLLYGDKTTWPKIVEVCKSITVGEALSPLMPEIYRISYDESQWEKDLVELKESEINHITGLETKIKPCVTIGS